MHSRILWEVTLLVVSAGATASVGQESPLIGSKRAVTVADTITMTKTADQAYLDAFSRSGNVAYFSPDGSKFAFVTQKGNLNNDTVEYSLLVFRSDEVFTRPMAELVAKLASSSNRVAITQLSWLPDNDSLVFIGEQPHEHPQLYRVTCSTRKLERLTESPGAVESYSFDAKGDAFVYEADVVPQPPLISSEMRHRGFTVTVERWDQLYEGTSAHPSSPLGQVFYKTAAMKAARPVGEPGYFVNLDFLRTPKMSPDGRFVLSIAEVTSPPTEWSQYTGSGWQLFNSPSCSEAQPSLCSAQYRLIDLEHGVDRPLLDSPIPRGLIGRFQAAWTRDGSLLLVNTFLPLADADPAERSRRIKNVYTVTISPANGKITKITEAATPYSAYVMEADREHDRFTVQASDSIEALPVVFHRDNGVWHVSEQKTPAETQKQNMIVTLDESLNTPPRLVASNPQTGRKAVVLDLNPQFAGLTFGRVELFDWKTRDGRIAEGELYYPPDYVPGKKYPLVIQTHGQTRERFWIDGPFTTAFAAQPLASRGFIVLQMGMGNRYDKASLDEWTADWGTEKEGPTAVAFFESAIDELDRRGLIDPHRVGMTGFSRTVYHVLYMLTHSDNPIGAAVVVDGINFSYADCVFYMQGSGDPICEKENGGLPYGPTLMNWRKAPTFNLDKVQAPVLLQSISAPLGEWEILAGLRWLNKPGEMLNFYPEGQHTLVQPQQRLLSQGSVVDWYCFWLKGEEDRDPAKGKQYKRWRELHKLQEANTTAAQPN
jgi:dipeptidyl aminopeptidase/acylaminoacyl peptidase